jgi:hypothetical protein
MHAAAATIHRAFTFSEGFHTPTTAPNAAAPIKQIIIQNIFLIIRRLNKRFIYDIKEKVIP